MIRVLSVIHYPFFGGPQNQVLRLSKPLRRRGFSTLVVLPDEPGNAYERLVEHGVEVRRIRLGRVRARLDWRTQRESVASLLGDVPRLRKILDEERINLVVLHGLVNPQGAIAARLGRRPVVWQILDMVAPPIVRAGYGPIVRALASSVMTTGRTVADAHPGLPRKDGRFFTFFPPVDTHVFAPDETDRASVRAAFGFRESEVIVGCVANFSPLKDLETFFAVARSVCAERDDVRFALFGRPLETHAAYGAELLQATADLRKRQRLVVRDVGMEVARHLRALDIFMATGKSEGIPTTVLEAMSSAIPVISTDVGGVREAVVHGETGYLVQSNDRPALVRDVTKLVEDHALRRRMGDAARRRGSEEFDVEHCADVHVQAFRAALARHSR